ncbi:MAG TPA: pilus assembly protein TadG-related protein [Roseiflexaceae bacterium]|nr:pilus assembly protein TadG-related protein [Roseiflexaceae bacterium]
MRQNIFHAHRAPGQSIALVALALLLLVALSGLALDGANAFNQRRNATNGADAAAIAGTRALIAQHKAGGGDNSAVYQAVEDYLNSHYLNQGVALTWEAYYVDRQAQQLAGAQVTNTSDDVPTDARGVMVELHYTFATVLMPVLGRPDLTVDATATAVYGPVTSVVGGDLIPLSISRTIAEQTENGDDLCIFGSESDTNPCGDSGAYQVQPGNFGQVSFNPNNAPNTTGNYNQDCLGNPAQHQDSMSRWWCQGSQYDIYIGMQLWGDTGMLSNSLADEMEWRLTNRPEGLVPVFGYVDDGSGNNARYTIVGFMAIRLEDFDVNGSADDRWVRAERINYYTTAGAFSSGAVDAGVYAINLVK